MASLLLLPILCAATFVGPGYAVVRRLRFAPLETLITSIGASLVLVYLASFAIFAARIPNDWHWLTTIVGALITIYFARELRRLMQHRAVRASAIALGVLLAWSMLLNCLIRHYSGGNWSWDWFEHYQRTQFFLRRFPLDYRFIEIYSLPARPPMMNVICAYALAHTGDSFAAYQLISIILSALAFLPCCLFLHRWRLRGGIALLAAAFMVSPVFMENVLFPWPKFLCAFYCLLAMHFYLRGWMKNSSRYFIAAFTSFAAALLVHYSAGPWVLLVTLHYLFRIVPRKPAPFRRIVTTALLPAILLSTWIGWSMHTYGLHTTLASNTTVTDSEKMTAAGNSAKVASNLYRTLLPHPAYISFGYISATFRQPSRLGFWRDYFFCLYQPNYILSMGIVGGVLVLILLWRELSPSSRSTPQRAFWRYFIPSVAFLGVAVHGSAAFWGAAHICLTPLTLLGITFLIAKFPRLPMWVRALAVVGWAIDFVFGVLFQIVAESRVFNIIHLSSTDDHVIKDAYSLTNTSIGQYDLKITQNLTFIGDYFANVQTPILIASIAIGCAAVVILARGRRGRI
jgi:hypothetical protein